MKRLYQHLGVQNVLFVKIWNINQTRGESGSQLFGIKHSRGRQTQFRFSVVNRCTFIKKLVISVRMAIFNMHCCYDKGPFTYDKGGRGVSIFLIFSDMAGRGGLAYSDLYD